MPRDVIQRFFYKWIPPACDLFGTDNSSSAHWAYVWGRKGRYDEREPQTEPDKAKLNELSRDLYRQEITKLVERLNMFIPDRSEEHTSELQSQSNLVCRLLLEKKKKKKYQ